MADPADYTVGWICAIKTEYVAAQVLLDEKHPQPSSVSPGDENNYALGKMGNHNIVISVLPQGEYGLSTASSVASYMVNSFPNVRIGLMVGIGGGAPSSKHDIRLGDVVVSATGNGSGGVFQYDFGKAIQDQNFQHTKFLNRPPPIVRGAVSGLQAQYEIEGHQIQDSIATVLNKYPRLGKTYGRPQNDSDRLYRSHIVHPPQGELCCDKLCGNDLSKLVSRHERSQTEDNPTIHYGLVASANTLCKDAKLRDILASERGVLCFEMEAAGLVNHFPCLVIRGICDYSDSHKSKEWQGYAAMTAAAYAKDLLQQISPSRVQAEKKLAETIAGLQEKVEAVSKTTDTILQSQRNFHDKKILSWLTSVNYGSHHSDNLERRQAGTCLWLLDSATFCEWRDTRGQTLFCPGLPGAGKTIATEIVIDYLEDRYRDIKGIGIAYVYCTYRLQVEQSTTNLLMSLLAQLIEPLPSIPKVLEQLYSMCEDKGCRPSVEEVSKLIESIMECYDKAFILVDALDEGRSSIGSKAFLQVLLSLRDKCGFNLFATSRPLPDIKESFDSSLELEISAKPDDVGRYLEARMKDLRPFVHTNVELKDQVKTEISQAVDGMFLLAHIYLESLSDKLTANSVREALKTMRKQKEFAAGRQNLLLDQAYDTALERVNGQKHGLRKMAMQIFSWITLAKRQLTTLELRHALAIRLGTSRLDPGDLPQAADVVSICAGLITTDEQTDAIRLAHYTTQEYFQQRQQVLFPDGNEDIARACVTYLTFDTFADGCCELKFLEERLRSNPLYDYSARHWGDHAGVVAMELQETIKFLDETDKVQASAQVKFRRLEDHFTGSSNIPQYPHDIEYYPSQLTGLLLAACLGLETSVRRLVKDLTWKYHWKYDPNLADKPFISPLLYAIESHNVNIAKMFLERRKTTFKCLVPPSCKNLFWTFTPGHSYMSPSLNIIDNGFNAIPVHQKFDLIQYDPMLEFLLQSGEISLNIQDHDGCTPFFRAVEGGDMRFASLFLQTNEVDMNRPDKKKRTPLLVAASRGDYNMVKCILQAGQVEINKADETGRTPLSEAARNNHERIVELLLSTGAFDIKEASLIRTEFEQANGRRFTPDPTERKRRRIDKRRETAW